MFFIVSQPLQQTNNKYHKKQAKIRSEINKLHPKEKYVNINKNITLEISKI